MFRFSTFLPFKTGLLLSVALFAIPASLNAQTYSQQKAKQLAETSTSSPANGDAKVNPIPTKTDSPSAPGQSVTNPASPANTTNAQPTTTPSAKPAVATGSIPPIEALNLVLKLKERRVYVYKGEKVLAKYPVAIGKKGRETPTGEWQVMEKIKNPGWTSFKTGEYMAPGRENPLGSRWIGFWTDGKDMIGFHGTSKLNSIGKAVSNGCVRMYNRDVKAMYKLVKVGTVVRVYDE